MSDEPRSPPPGYPRSVPLMAPQKARDLARMTKALSEMFAEEGMAAQSNRMLRESEWWLGYALTLEATKGKEAGP